MDGLVLLARRLGDDLHAGVQNLVAGYHQPRIAAAEQLIGVTMQEQGVSRIVAVDMEAALGFAEVTA